MRRRLAKFSQRDWAEKYGVRSHGFCYTVCADWCKNILRDTRKQRFYAPAQSSEARMLAFDSQIVATSIAADHARYEAANDENRRSRVVVSQVMLEVAKTKYLDVHDNRNLITATHELVDAGLAIGDGVLRGGLNARGVLAGTFIETTPGLCHIYLQAACAYVITFPSGDSGHAIAVYVTSGIFTWDYYLFDPNYGEFLSNSYDDFDFHLKALLETYGNPKLLKLVEVRLL